MNSIAPGYFPTEMTVKGSDERNKVHMPKEKVKDKAHEVHAGRAGSNEVSDLREPKQLAGFRDHMIDPRHFLQNHSEHILTQMHSV